MAGAVSVRHSADIDDLPVVPLRHPGRWVGAAVAALTLGGVLWSLAKNQNVDLVTIRHYVFDTLTLQGLVVTLVLTVVAMVIGILGAILVAVMRLSSNPVLAGVAKFYIWLFRGTPILVQLIFWGYFGAIYPRLAFGPPFTGITWWSGRTADLISPTVAAILALGLNEVAYAAEIVRGGILAVDHGQVEAAHALGMTPARTMRRIVLPQAMRVIIPPMGNETITMLKTTSLVSVIAGHDLMTNLQDVYSQNFKVIPLLIVASIWYLALTSLLSVPQRWLERRYGRGVAGVPVGTGRRLIRLPGLGWAARR